ncbi:MAG: hypothetical protein JOY94_11905, partial [Methylobacteriaceae bacterium]|nr:hypothetical protein [Methylobacteriaceae bacterium]
MTDWTGTLDDFAPVYRRRPSRKLTSQIAPAAALAFSVALSAWKLYSLPAGDPSLAPPPVGDAATMGSYGALPAQSRAGAGPAAAAANATPGVFGSLLRPKKPASGAANPAFAVAFAWDSPAQNLPPGAKGDEVPAAPSVAPQPQAALPGAPASETADIVPLPIPRPPTLQSTPNRNLLRPPRQVAQNRAGVPAAPPDNRNFFEKLFGIQPSSPALAYASPEDGRRGNTRSIVASPSAGLASSPAGFDRYTAIYDISAHTVYLPNGMRLEAHSGLGNRLDDPRYVSERDRGATPPNVYELEARTELFHGVQ